MNMVEKVARAICASERLAKWEEHAPEGHAAYCETARAAIEAMREPTGEMLKAGYAAFGPTGLYLSYRAMIDAALNEGDI